MSVGKQFLKILGKILAVLFAAALLALAAVSLILAKPQDGDVSGTAEQARLSASPALEIQDENSLPDLIGDFPAPVMSFMSGSGMSFVSGLSSDVSFDGQFARTATLYWQTADGTPFSLQSICPADAYSVLDRGFHFTTAESPTLFGNSSVRMENDQLIRVHTATDQALYVLLVPRSLNTQIPEICRSLQLFTVRTPE